MDRVKITIYMAGKRISIRRRSEIFSQSPATQVLDWISPVLVQVWVEIVITMLWRRSWERYKNGCLQSTVKHGRGCVVGLWLHSASGVGDLIKTDGIIKAEKHHQFSSTIQFPLESIWFTASFFINTVKGYLDRKKQNTIRHWLTFPEPGSKH